MDLRINPKLKTVAIAGTFDRLHKGHEYFIKQAFKYGEQIIIGLTSDEYVRSKITHKIQIQNFQIREKVLTIFLKQEGLLARAEIVKIDDLYGPAIDKNTKIEAIVVTRQTLPGGRAINKARLSLSLPPLKLIVIPFVLAKDRKLISSTRIRLGEIDRWGNVFNKITFKEDKFPDNLRLILKKPIGQVLQHDNKSKDQVDLRLKEYLDQNKNSLIISVGDEVTKTLNLLNQPADLAIIDFKVQRKQKYKKFTDLLFPLKELKKRKLIYVDNPAGHIKKKLIKIIYQSFQKIVSTDTKVIIKVNGEEDLAGVPALLIAPLDSILIYGQPNVGITVVKITEAVKQRLFSLIRNFDKMDDVAQFVTEDSVPKKAAEKIWHLISHNMYQKKCILLLLSGGSAVTIYQELTNLLLDNNFDPKLLVIGQVDERFIKIPNIKNPFDNPSTSLRTSPQGRQKSKIRKEINAEKIGETGLWKACRIKGILYYLVSQKGSLKTAANKYNRTISKLFKLSNFKIAVLGIGEDGHTAGLMPGYRKLWDKKQMVVGYENHSKFPKRITITPFALMQADYAIIYAQGERKRQVLLDALKRKQTTNLNKYPATICQKIKQLEIFTDIRLI